MGRLLGSRHLVTVVLAVVFVVLLAVYLYASGEPEGVPLAPTTTVAPAPAR